MANEDSDPEDLELFEELERELEDGFDMGALRERRMEELKRECVQTIHWTFGNVLPSLH